MDWAGPGFGVHFGIHFAQIARLGTMMESVSLFESAGIDALKASIVLFMIDSTSETLILRANQRV